VADLVGGDDDGRQRPAVEILRRQSDRFRERMSDRPARSPRPSPW
jgi:hypothetical protein